MTGVLGRVGAFFLETTGSPPPAVPHVTVAGPPPARAAVLGAPAVVVAVAAACAGELRARSGSAAALLCIWLPSAEIGAGVPAAPGPESEPEVPAARSPAGATTPGASRLAARLAAHGLPATACGRLAWLGLRHEPVAAAEQFRRCEAVAGAPLVLAIAGPRPAEFEPLLAAVDVSVAVLPAPIEPALRDLALATLPARASVVVPPLGAGPPRWAALAGLARLRSLPGAGG